MGFPLGSTLANAFLGYHEKNWLERCPLEHIPFYHLRYVEDTFVLLNSPGHLKVFQLLKFSLYQHIFTIENEKDNRMPFLEINIIREQSKFTTSVYRKPTFSRIYTHFDSFLPSFYKSGMSHTLLNRYF